LTKNQRDLNFATGTCLVSQWGCAKVQ